MSNKVYILVSEAKQPFKTLTFTLKSDAESYIKAFPEQEYKIHDSEVIMNLNALAFIDWNDVPKRFNFIYKDSDGVHACYYKPSKSKWFNSNSSHYKLYGGEKFTLVEKNYHHLIKLGDIFERPYGRTNHFINWKKINGSHFIKFVDDSHQKIDIFNNEGELLYSGTNKEVQIIDINKTMRFNSFLWQTYTFEKELS